MQSAVRLVTGTDGTAKQCRALLTFIHSLRVAGLVSPDGIDVLCAPGSESHVRAGLGSAGRLCRVFAPTCTLPPNDPYALKFLLTSSDWLGGNDADALLYLDYDHLAYRVPDLPAAQDGIIWISSQQDPLTDLDVPTWPSGLQRHLGGLHPNTSLIYLTRGSMRACAQEWRDCYQELLHVVGHRWREEVAFGWAARRAGIELRHVALDVQASWRNAAADCTLFHYGGETEAANVIKEQLLQTDTPDGMRRVLLKAESLEMAAYRRVLDVADALRNALSLAFERST